MRRRRLVVMLGAAVAGLSLTGAPAAAKSIGGIAADVRTGSHLRVARIADSSMNLPYGGGPVLHSNRTYVIFWVPQGSGMSFPPGYQSLVTGFLANVAWASHRPYNVYALTGQYYDSSGRAMYDSTFGGAVLATDPLPGNGCTEPVLTGPPGWTHCMTDAQLETEIQHVVAINHLPAGSGIAYFLLTPDGLGDCQDSSSSSCALGGSVSGYCGYHSQTPDNSIIYAVIPYNAVNGHCQSDNPRPNNNPADPALSTLSHEHNEIITDPLGNAWIDSSGNENGDLCLTTFGNNVGGSGNGAWNEAIHGARYYLQEEYSNEDNGCMARDEVDPISMTLPRRAVMGKRTSFVAHVSDPDGSIVSTTWNFGSGAVGHGRLPVHTYKRAGLYRVVVTTVDAAGNRATSSKYLRVTRR